MEMKKLGKCKAKLVEIDSLLVEINRVGYPNRLGFAQTSV